MSAALLLTALAAAQEGVYPKLVTAETRADREALAALQRPGRVLFEDGFESDTSFASWFEVRGRDAGRAAIERDPDLVRSGEGALRLVAPARDGKASGAGASLWLGAEGHDRVHLRWYMRYAEDYNQGNLHHSGGGLAGVAGDNRWGGMGMAGVRPAGDDRFTTGVEGWRDWGRVAPPGFLHCYTYWVDMKRGRDGNWWGNMMEPARDDRFVPKRGAWHCVELMVSVNTVGKADGELAVWVDGKLYLHYRGFRWRTDDAVRIKRATLDVYVHRARRDNTVWFDDVVLSTGYVGPARK